MFHRSLSRLLFLFVLGLLSTGLSLAQPGLPVQPNSIQVAADTSQKGVIKVYGSYSTKQNVTLTKVEVWAFRTTGGLFPPQTETKAKAGEPKAWGDAVLNVRVYKGQYAIRADGHFSDGEVLTSGYILTSVDGDPYVGEATLDWKGSFPKSEASNSITTAGSYTGSLDTKLGGIMYLTPANGGKITKDVFGLTKLDAQSGIWSGLHKVPVGALKYEVIGYASDTNENRKFYSTPFSSLFVMP